MAKLSTDARNLNWLVANFARATPGVSHARGAIAALLEWVLDGLRSI
jgi:hypothetical protein